VEPSPLGCLWPFIARTENCRTARKSAIHSADGIWGDHPHLQGGAGLADLGRALWRFHCLSLRSQMSSSWGLMSCESKVIQWSWGTMWYNWAKKKCHSGDLEYCHDCFRLLCSAVRLFRWC
jgi:hypothetical protein